AHLLARGSRRARASREVLRIVQEGLGNARRHAKAEGRGHDPTGRLTLDSVPGRGTSVELFLRTA
ncbi:MAG TPA: hypothetical protein VK926_07360, partial [Gaiellaceae bacterium]|nr:hypothetical protein [Gaiellaceae bacterium]